MQINEIEIGDILKKIRLSHNYTQEYVSNNIISRSYLSLLESNKYSPSIKILLELLERLNTELDEFVFLIQQEMDKNNDNLRFNTIENYAEYTEKEYLELKNHLEKKYSEDKLLKYKHLLIVLEAHCKFKSKKNLLASRKSVDSINSYFKSINSWTIYDFRLFNNTMFCFSTEEILDMMPMISEYIEKYSSFFLEKNNILSFICNLCTLLIMENKYDPAIEYASFGKNIAQKNKQLYQWLFLKCIICYCNSKVDTSNPCHMDHLEEKLHLAKQLECMEILEFFEKLCN
ncbi:helix-turn-helix domain-containing protein [Enterococcus wangshanyuanii]|uniref:HTH cro/C1-type domain-containing protein n=1 Tax=Enterococcus wangshanyuanii TaxID=2005703 RepID=A0ABQ1NGM0_9ENTE|nr:Rgg/GadR/MutR family transcriptional regulator [Enterococcus wangshanyuanii]GGC76669.1 hypothetical protein GCM10011573_02830 [Enterococcus wangshanyuanii]